MFPLAGGQDTTLGSVWAFFNYMGGVKDWRCKTRFMAGEGKSESQSHRGEERTQRIWVGGESGVGDGLAGVDLEGAVWGCGDWPIRRF